MTSLTEEYDFQNISEQNMINIQINQMAFILF
jgi:hypothetical protein